MAQMNPWTTDFCRIVALANLYARLRNEIREDEKPGSHHFKRWQAALLRNDLAKLRAQMECEQAAYKVQFNPGYECCQECKFWDKENHK